MRSEAAVFAYVFRKWTKTDPFSHAIDEIYNPLFYLSFAMKNGEESNLLSMITIKPVVIPTQRRRDGTYNIKIRITYKRRYRILSTHLNAAPNEVSRTGQLRSSMNYLKANAIVMEMYKLISDLDYFTLTAMDVDDIVSLIGTKLFVHKDRFELDFFDFADRFIRRKCPGTAAAYRTAVNAFRRFTGRDSLDINSINVLMLRQFMRSLDDGTRKVPGAAAYSYITRIKTIFAAAQDEYNDEDNGHFNIPKNPFAKLRIRQVPMVARISKSPDFIRKIIGYDGPCTKTERLALDVFLLSFGLMGMNAADMMEAPPLRGNVLVYNRKKTRSRRADNAEMRVRIEPCLEALVARYADPEGEYAFCFCRRFSNALYFSQTVRRGLISWAKKNGEEPFTLYSARHSWATIARSSLCNIDKATIDECLCHVNQGMKMADIYIEKDWSVLWDANQKVLRMFY